MKRVLPIIALVAAAVVVIVLVAGNREDNAYRVRAIFDNADFVIAGEDVKVAGVRVGKISALDVTPDFKAAVTLEITQPGYQDFRRDASCIVRPQSLIGERFVECTPTQPRAAGTEAPPPLSRIERGPGAGEYLLPVENTQHTVDIDLIGNTMREPERVRLSLILNELGTGLAGRGADLNEVIRRADPALKETNRVLAILASQNRVLQDLAVNSDTVLAPLARERAHVAGAIRNSSEVAQATAERSVALAADIRTLPRFLDELDPTMVRLGALSDEAAPVFADLGAVAPSVNLLIERLGPFSQAAIPAVESLGEAAKIGIPAVTAARPVVADTRALAKAVRPVGATAAALLESFSKTQGIERLMDYIFYQTAAINGFDALGHYLRAELLVNQCASYAIRPVAGCSANFANPSASSSSVASVADAVGDDPVMLRTARALARALGQEVKQTRTDDKQADAKRKRSAAKRDSKPDPAALLPDVAATATPAPVDPTTLVAPGPSGTVAPSSTPTPTPSPAGDPLLDYLFGGDGG